MGDKSVLRHYHRDAEDLFGLDERFAQSLLGFHQARSSIETGRHRSVKGLVNPQLAKRQNSVDAVYKALKGKQFVVETKFDGERIQIHKDGDAIPFTGLGT